MLKRSRDDCVLLSLFFFVCSLGRFWPTLDTTDMNTWLAGYRRSDSHLTSSLDRDHYRQSQFLYMVLHFSARIDNPISLPLSEQKNLSCRGESV